jgi:2-methylisocitrate lyase-like PEP mutase family enzyme
MAEFGETPFFTASEFKAMGYRMVIWPVGSLRVTNKAKENVYAASPVGNFARSSGCTTTRRRTHQSSRPSSPTACHRGRTN